MRGRGLEKGLAIGCWAALVGCGGSSTGGADTTGPGQTAGTSGASTSGAGGAGGVSATGGASATGPDLTGGSGGTGGGATSIPSQGALYVTVAAPSGAGSCPVDSAYSAPSGDAALAAIRDHGGEDPNTGEVFREVDGADGATITCRVSVTDGGAFVAVDVDLTFQKSRSVSFQAAGNMTAAGGLLHVIEWDNQTGQTLQGDCMVTTHAVQRGAIYGTFECPSFSDGALMECAASGAFVFENCDR